MNKKTYIKRKLDTIIKLINVATFNEVQLENLYKQVLALNDKRILTVVERQLLTQQLRTGELQACYIYWSGLET
jgi:hypothetical protein